MKFCKKSKKKSTRDKQGHLASYQKDKLLPHTV